MEAQINNTAEQRKIRKSQNTLVIVGSGIMMFAVWVALKMYSMVLLRTSAIVDDIRDALPEGSTALDLSNRQLIMWTLFFVTLYVLVEAGVRCFVGLSAIAEGRGGSPKRLYIPVTYILIIAGIVSIGIDITAFVGIKVNGSIMEEAMTSTTIEDLAASTIIDLTSLIMLIQMLVSSFRVKKNKKLQKEAEADHAA